MRKFLHEKCGADFVRACAVEMHVNMSQEPFYAEIYEKKCGQLGKVDQTPVFPTTVRITQCGRIVSGEGRTFAHGIRNQLC